MDPQLFGPNFNNKFITKQILAAKGVPNLALACSYTKYRLCLWAKQCLFYTDIVFHEKCPQSSDFTIIGGDWYISSAKEVQMCWKVFIMKNPFPFGSLWTNHTHGGQAKTLCWKGKKNLVE